VDGLDLLVKQVEAKDVIFALEELQDELKGGTK